MTVSRETRPWAAEIDTARRAAGLASDLIRSRWGRVLSVAFKGEVDLVTEVDLASEALILEVLRAAFPTDTLVAEESSAGALPTQGRVWYIDPLDGTTNFSHGLPHFAVSIGLVIDGEPVVGVVADPIRPWTFHATRGGGAWLDDRPLRVSATARLGHALVATGFPHDRRTAADNNSHRHNHMLRRAQCVRRNGAAALDLAYVAAGWLDGYFEERLKPWDVSAGALLVQEAGGRVTGPHGRPFAPIEGAAWATNGVVHDEMVAELALAEAAFQARLAQGEPT